MKGIILAGGTGSRLYPLTYAINKHVLPVGNFPMIFYPVYKLRQAGIKQIVIVTNSLGAWQMSSLLGSGLRYGVDLTYKIQDQAGGIADALRLAADFAQGQRLVVLLGDNLFGDDLTHYLEEYASQSAGARIFLKKVADPSGYGVAVTDAATGKVTRIIEKPQTPISDLCVTGIYMYDTRVFELLQTLKPSARGELEITDLNNAYLQKGMLEAAMLNGWWTDAGTPDTLKIAAEYVKELKLEW